MSKSLPEFALEYGQAWDGHDADSIAAMHTDDSVFHLHDLEAPASGRAAVRQLLAMLIANAPDVQFAPIRAHFGADHFVTEYTMSGTVSGKQFAVDGADVFTMRDGLIERKDSYVDWLAYERQTGHDVVADLKRPLPAEPSAEPAPRL